MKVDAIQTSKHDAISALRHIANWEIELMQNEIERLTSCVIQGKNEKCKYQDIIAKIKIVNETIWGDPCRNCYMIDVMKRGNNVVMYIRDIKSKEDLHVVLLKLLELLALDRLIGSTLEARHNIAAIISSRLLKKLNGIYDRPSDALKRIMEIYKGLLAAYSTIDEFFQQLKRRRVFVLDCRYKKYMIVYHDPSNASLVLIYDLRRLSAGNGLAFYVYNKDHRRVEYYTIMYKDGDRIKIEIEQFDTLDNGYPSASLKCDIHSMRELVNCVGRIASELGVSDKNVVKRMLKALIDILKGIKGPFIYDCTIRLTIHTNGSTQG